MCGIAGIFHTQDRSPVPEVILHRMNERQRHRGPDGEGLFHGPGIGLAHRRLSIIDLAAGQQPFYSDDHRTVLIFNGEIYNFQALRKELEERGHRFFTRSDTEVLLHAWLEWNENCVSHLQGMFAFAVWDDREERLFLARDRFGIKPLHYTLLPCGTFLFSSELKALLEHPECPLRIRPDAVEDYLSLGYIPAPKTVYLGIHKLRPGHTLSLSRAEPKPCETGYWKLSFRTRPGPSADLEKELVRRLGTAVESRMIADVPLGAFLSGGVDSSAVTALMAKARSEPVTSCTIAFGGDPGDETAYARIVADRYHTNANVDHVEAGALSDIDSLVGMFDEPFADHSSLPTHRVCQAARRHVTVALSGDGGDELFAGYRRYRRHMHENRLRGLLPAMLRTAAFKPAAALLASKSMPEPLARAGSILHRASLDPLSGYMHCAAAQPYRFRNALLHPELINGLGGYSALEILREHAAQADTEDPLSLVQFLDTRTYLADDILTKVDRTSMACSLEVRVPIIDHLFAEWACGLPSSLKLKNGQGKHILKKALEPLLPPEVLYRPKQGFTMPISKWFREAPPSVLEKRLAGAALMDSRFIRHDTASRLVSLHRTGRRDYAPTLWSLLMLESFLRTRPWRV